MSQIVDMAKIDQIVTVLSGLKRYEWSLVVKAVDRAYNSASSELELNDAEKLTNLLKVEFFPKLNL